MVKLVAVALLLWFVPTAAGAAPEDDPRRSPSPARGGPRLRPNDARSGALLLQGIERSTTLRAIVDELERHDVIVYIEMQPALNARLAGALTLLAHSGNFRYVRVSLNPRLNTTMAIATIGHELQHALEVAREPGIVDAASLEAHYQQHGISMPSHNNGWDTAAARSAGYDVRRELADTSARHVAESIQDFSPERWRIVYRRARSMLPP